MVLIKKYKLKKYVIKFIWFQVASILDYIYAENCVYVIALAILRPLCAFAVVVLRNDRPKG